MTTYSIDTVTPAVAAVNVEQFDRTSLIQLTPSYDVTKGAASCVYRVPAADPSHISLDIVVRTQKGPTTGLQGERRMTLTATSVARVDSGVAGIEPKLYPVVATLSIAVPDMGVEVGDVRQFVDGLYSMTYKALNTGDPDTLVLTKLMQGAVAGLYS